MGCVWVLRARLYSFKKNAYFSINIKFYWKLTLWHRLISVQCSKAQNISWVPSRETWSNPQCPRMPALANTMECVSSRFENSLRFGYDRINLPQISNLTRWCRLSWGKSSLSIFTLPFANKLGETIRTSQLLRVWFLSWICKKFRSFCFLDSRKSL